ncbi:CehA/McbA family metallohydrolase [Actinomadura sp. ATCC 31491]|uniref:CehA/McbA family metallohydrolase n=1 Tax=Actinomadura luzonensis TaxID=2805427 RepID=A0ABT0FJ31_9ACTN|nr:CehA/McbA family metallohydrolase [Actinomadura luzonensis]MCK2212306.1 CehA/McbA family metallohydrolase [Actinomadura luzonensis]
MHEYHHLLERHGVTWGEELIPYVGEVRTSAYLMNGPDYWSACLRQLGDGATRRDLDSRMGELDLDRVVRDALDGAVPDNLAVLRLTPAGPQLAAVTLAVLGDAPLRTTLLLDSRLPEQTTVTVDGVAHVVPPGGARLVPITSAATVIAGAALDLGPLTRRVPAARLRLRAGFPCRWSVTGRGGQGWYPHRAVHALDAHLRPYFHGDDLELDVPAEPLTVSVTRGMEYGTATAQVTPAPGRQVTVELTPGRLYDAAARGWYGGDLHVHLNWMGDEPATPARAAAAQHGEDLHVLNLVAGNVAGERVYDREALEEHAGRDLPWSDATHVARFGVEYRNDLLGHVTGFGPTGVPARFHSGFGDDPDAWPNADALAELRALGALTGYGHPFHTDLTDTDPPERAVAAGRNCSARELVVDAALGLVDGLDVINHSSVRATAVVYRRLIGAGNRLAATAGTDAVLSISRRGTASSPPGWARVYARLDGPLTASSFADAVRRGRTFATTGPWLELDVGGHGPGDTLRAARGETVTVTAATVGPEVEWLQLRTAGGVLAEGGPGRLTAELTVDGPTYVVAVAGGGPHPRALHPAGAYAHTSPVYLGEPVVRRADVAWCLRWLGLLEELLDVDGRFTSREQRDAHRELHERARQVYLDRLRHAP